MTARAACNGKPAEQPAAAHILADRLERLRWTAGDPSIFLGERQSIARELRLLTVPISPTAIRIETPDPRQDERLRRALALGEHYRREHEKLAALLAGERRPARRRRIADERQANLFHLKTAIEG